MSDAQALAELQKEFVLYEASGDIFTLRVSEINDTIRGNRMDPINFFKKNAAETLIKRHLENLPITNPVTRLSYYFLELLDWMCRVKQRAAIK